MRFQSLDYNFPVPAMRFQLLQYSYQIPAKLLNFSYLNYSYQNKGMNASHLNKIIALQLCNHSSILLSRRVMPKKIQVAWHATFNFCAGVD